MPPQRIIMSSTLASGSMLALGSSAVPASTHPGAQAFRPPPDDTPDVVFRAEAAPANGAAADGSGFAAAVDVCLRLHGCPKEAAQHANVFHASRVAGEPPQTDAPPQVQYVPLEDYSKFEDSVKRTINDLATSTSERCRRLEEENARLRQALTSLHADMQHATATHSALEANYNTLMGRYNRLSADLQIQSDKFEKFVTEITNQEAQRQREHRESLQQELGKELNESSQGGIIEVFICQALGEQVDRVEPLLVAALDRAFGGQSRVFNITPVSAGFAFSKSPDDGRPERPKSAACLIFPYFVTGARWIDKLKSPAFKDLHAGTGRT